MRELRILQVCSADSAGGGERHVSDLARALIERGHHLHLAVRRDSPLREMCAGIDIHWHELPLRNAADFKSAHLLARLLIEHRIDVIHGHVARDYPVCGLAARMARKRLFLTRHHYRPFARSRLYQWAISPVENLIAVSTSVARGLALSFPSLADRVVVIPNWIDSSQAGTIAREEARRRLGIRRSLAVGVIGTLGSIKRQDLVVKAAALLKVEGIRDIDFVIVGGKSESEKEYGDYLKGLAVELDVVDETIFAGHVPEFAKYLSGLDIVVSPSINEGFSLVVIEAMAAGLPVIASRIGGPAEIIDDGKTGILVPVDEPGALVHAVARLSQDAGLRQKLGSAAATDTRRRFDREQIISRIEALYLGQLD